MALFTSALLSLGTSLGVGALSSGGAALSFFVSAGTALINTAVGVGLNLLAQAVAGKPKQPGFSVSTTLRAGGDTPRTFILGKYATAGSLVWANTWGQEGDTPNANLTQVIALSDLPVSGLAELWVNGKKCTISPTPWGPQGYPVTDFNDPEGYPTLWINFYDGTQTGADLLLATWASNAQRTWTVNRVGIGVAYAVMTARSTKNTFSGIPSFKFVLNGLKLYDITKDSTAGGSGSHRWDNPATWGGDGDHFPAVMAYNLLRGLTYDGEWFYGLQDLPATRLPADNWIAAIGKCRATVTEAGGAVASYRAGMEVPVDAPLANTLEALNTACLGRITEIGGFYRMYVGAPGSATISFTDDDILSSEEQSFTPFLGLNDTINGIAATYVSPSDGWTEKAAPPIYRDDLEEKHGNRRLMADVGLGMVPYPEQVQRLMKAALAEGQRARRHTLTLPPRFWPYAVPGEVLSWTSGRNGYEGKLFRIDGVVDRANLDVVVDITEVDPDDYDWDTGTDFDEPVDGAVGPIIPSAQPILDWDAEPATVDDNDGNPRRPAILLLWDNERDHIIDVVGVEYEVRLAESLTSVAGGRTDQPEVGSLLISQGLLPATDYEVRGRYLPGGDRLTLWSDWIAVTTPNIRITDVEVKLAALAEEVRAVLQQQTANFNAAMARVEQVALSQAEAAGASIKSDGVFRRYKNATAGVLTEQSAAIEEIDGGLTATAESVTLLMARVGGTAAGILWRMQAYAADGGANARVEMQLSADDGENWTRAGTLWEVGTSPSLFGRMLMYADEIIMTDGSGTKVPFAFIDGQLYLNDVIVGVSNLSFGQIVEVVRELEDDTLYRSNPPDGVPGWESIHDFTIDNTLDPVSPVWFGLTGTLFCSRTGAGGVGVGLRLDNDTTGRTVWESEIFLENDTNIDIVEEINASPTDFFCDPGENKYALRVWATQPGGQSSLSFGVDDFYFARQHWKY